MITVDEVIKKGNKAGKSVNAAGEEKMMTGEVKALKQPLWPWIIGIIGLAAFGLWWYKKGKNNGEVPS